MVALLGASGALTGGLVGLAAGALWAGLGLLPLGPVTTALVIGAALVADRASQRWPTLLPLAVGRQVPEAWGRLFGARLAATLYGARLGVGPLTVLRTWTWWAALLVGASLDPWPSAGVGVTFALSRTAATVVTGRGAATGVVMRDRMAALNSAEPLVAAGTTWLLAAAAVTLVLA